MPLDVARDGTISGNPRLGDAGCIGWGKDVNSAAWDRSEESNAQMKSIKWAANLDGVREVSLWGTADAAYWRDYLASEGLVPDELDGKARIMIVAAEGRFMSLPFREISFSSRNQVPGPTFRAFRVSAKRFTTLAGFSHFANECFFHSVPAW